MIVVKFGGSSLADVGQIKKVIRIVQDNRKRQCIVVSAPGKRNQDDRKVTDLLYLCHSHVVQRLPFDEVFQVIRERFYEIVQSFSLTLDIEQYLSEIERRLISGESVNYAVSRGEYLSALILSELLGYEFIDAADVILFDDNGRLDLERTVLAIKSNIGSQKFVVVPGFYGSMPDGSIKTFSRGGSDISGSILARGLRAELYENWTDVSGLLMADPQIVEAPKPIRTITYRELRELTYMGASVLHEEAILFLRDAGIPVQIYNTNNPDDPGTTIVYSDPSKVGSGNITGIAGRKDFTVIAIEKVMMNQEIGFGRRLLGIFESNGISYEHTPSGIDSMSVVVSYKQIDDKIDKVIAEIRLECSPDKISVHAGMALIATVGQGMAYTRGISAKLFTALAKEGINVRMIDQGSSEINIIIGVESEDFEGAIRAIYHTFVS